MPAVDWRRCPEASEDAGAPRVGLSRLKLVAQARGDPEAPLAREEIIAKAKMLLQFGGVADPDSLIAAVLALADDGPLPVGAVREPPLPSPQR